MLTISYRITIIQARILAVVGIAWLGLALYVGHDPLTAAWRAVAAGLLTTLVCGMILRHSAGVIYRRLQELEAAEAASQEANDDISSPDHAPAQEAV
ncbi:MAG: hypothetical protein EA401_04660 [Planctomycetota bacterium]|nr:MAG: hypothetical protein EA401_04660 [Planctomycetota bacterium]